MIQDALPNDSPVVVWQVWLGRSPDFSRIAKWSSQQRFGTLSVTHFPLVRVTVAGTVPDYIACCDFTGFPILPELQGTEP